MDICSARNTQKEQKIGDPFGPLIDPLVLTDGFLVVFSVVFVLQMSILSSKTLIFKYFPWIFLEFLQNFQE